MDDVDFDDLDPCCQREVLERKKESEVDSQLRSVDRSEKRLDLTDQVFENLLTQCNCCSKSEDYPLLSKVRLLESEKEEISYEKASIISNDSDLVSDEDLDFLTPYEIERMQQMKERANLIEKARSFGYGVHVEESLNHLNSDIKNGFNIVLHVYDINSELSARIDLYFENYCVKYIGTKFRRISLSKVRTDSNLSKLLDSSNSGALICFSNKISTSSSSEKFFGDLNDGNIYESDLIRFLENSHVLSETMEVKEITNISRRAADVRESDDDDEKNELTRYCENPNCRRMFPHEHVGNTSEGGQQSTASFLMCSPVADEVFSKDALRKV